MTITRIGAASGVTMDGPPATGFDVATVSTDEIITPGDTSESVDQDANVITHTTAEYDKQFQLVPEPNSQGYDTFEFESNDPDHVSVSENGFMSIEDTEAGLKNVTFIVKHTQWSKRLFKDVTLNVGRVPSSSTTLLDSWVSGSLAKAASDAVDNRIDGLDPATALDMYESGYPQTLVRNSNCWCSGVDTTAISPRNDYISGQYRGGTLITPRDMLLCSHWEGVGPGDQYEFVKMDGTVVTMTIASVAEVAGGWDNGVDLKIATFSEDVPSGISPAKLPPADIADYLPNLGYGIPCLGLDQQEHATVRDLYRLGSATATTRFRRPTDAQRNEFYEDMVLYDSGNPACMIADFGSGSDELMVLTVWTFGGGGGGEAVYAYLDEIDDALEENGTPYRTSDAGRIADLSGYTNYG